MAVTQAVRKRLGLYYTPPDLCELLTTRTLADIDAVGDWSHLPRDRPVRVLDPACGDGRLLEAIRIELHLRGHPVEMVGCDIDEAALGTIAHPSTTTLHANALEYDWGEQRFDIVIGNPPYLSQMASSTTRGGSSRHGGGPYADAAAEFLALAVRLADPEHGRVSLVLPQSVLASRDAGPIRDEVDQLADHAWSWWVPEQQLFEANVNVCVLGFRRPTSSPAHPLAWTRVVTDALGIPPIDPSALAIDGALGDRAEFNLNFRDEYYALVPAVADEADGPPLVTSGLIDPGVNHWGHRPVKFAKQTFVAPRVDLDQLEGRFVDWASRKLVPKVLIANQTRVIEAVADPDGAWIPGVPVTTATPLTAPHHDDPAEAVWELAAVLTSPVASALCWHQAAGTGLSATTVRLSPSMLAALPWPGGSLTNAVAALRHGDVSACGRAVLAAYGLADDEAGPLVTWWSAGLPRRSGGAAGDS
jgi:hypothetical protein